MSAISATGLVKKFGKVTALDGLDFEVDEGTVLGLLGPNGAGKTTAVSIITTLLEPDSGFASVAGIDVQKNPSEVRKRIGLSGQYAAVDETLTGLENLNMIGRLYHLPKKVAKERANQLLERFDLTDAAKRSVKTYSGGMRRRLDLAGALVAEPEILILDEPTTGLDPRSRLDLWDIIRDLVDQGSTLLLTTQYLEEADRLADEILVIDNGKAIAQGTADELKTKVGGERIEATVSSEHEVESVANILAKVSEGKVETNLANKKLSASIAGGSSTLSKFLQETESQGIQLVDVGLRRPTLDDVFLTLTGQRVDTPQDQENSQEAER